MARRSIQLGGKHICFLFGIPIDDNMSVHRKAELAIQKILRSPIKLNFLLSLDIIFIDELGQLSSDLMAILLCFANYETAMYILGGCCWFLH
jgi:hypothetical protein